MHPVPSAVHSQLSQQTCGSTVTQQSPSDISDRKGHLGNKGRKSEGLSKIRTCPRSHYDLVWCGMTQRGKSHRVRQLRAST